MSDWRFGSDDHSINVFPKDWNEDCFDKADYVEVDDNKFVRERTCDGCAIPDYPLNVCEQCARNYADLYEPKVVDE